VSCTRDILNGSTAIIVRKSLRIEHEPRCSLVFQVKSGVADAARIVTIRYSRRFDPMRPDSDYIHFGRGLHQYFRIHISKATLHMMPKPLLKRKGVRRASGSAGRLRKNGAFAEALTVEFS
jgi:hypothetical protein